MALDVLQYVTLTGPAFCEPFVRFELEKSLAAKGLLAKTSGTAGRELQESWDVYRRYLRELLVRAGAVRVRNHVVEPLVERLGYARIEDGGEVATREGNENGGAVLVSTDGASRLRVWSIPLDEDLDAPARRGAAFRYSHVRVAQRVLLAAGERVGLLTNGIELRILISDPARPDSQIAIRIDPEWKRSRDVPDTYRLLLALASPAGVGAVPVLVEQARLQQTRVTKELRSQAKAAIRDFLQAVLDHPENRGVLDEIADADRLARDLWHEGLIVVYRLLVILKLETTDDPARSFSFASSGHWRNTFSPNTALARHVPDVLAGRETGRLLEDGTRALFRMFAEGLQCTEMNVQPLGGALFGDAATPLLAKLHWGERGVALLFDRLLWTTARRGSDARERVHYGPLDVEDLGRVYEALLELEPGIASEPMCRLKRQKLEVVVPASQGEGYRPAAVPAVTGDESDDESDDAEEVEDADEAPARGKKAKVEWVEAVSPGSFYLRVGLGRKASGSYYTPHSFVRFLVQETLGPQVAERSPKTDPRPGEILKLRVLDPAMGSGHFLVEACRFLGEKLYEACRLCDDRALDLERRAESLRPVERDKTLHEAAAWRARVEALPDGSDEIARYLPSRAPEGRTSGLSQKKADALCRRLVAVHCLYGVDKNPLAVELAKVSLWIEAHAEGLPLTFLDHRLVVGDSLTGPFFEHLLTYPGTQQPMKDLYTSGLRESLKSTLGSALDHVRTLEADVGPTIAAYHAKEHVKSALDAAIAPLRLVAAAWAGGVMLGPVGCDDTEYANLVRAVTKGEPIGDVFRTSKTLPAMVARGLGLPAVAVAEVSVDAIGRRPDSVPALPYEIAFPEVFFRGGSRECGGFDAVLGNPPWEGLDTSTRTFFANFDLSIMDARTEDELQQRVEHLLKHEYIRLLHEEVSDAVDAYKATARCFFRFINQSASAASGATPDLYQLFLERSRQLLCNESPLGLVLPAAVHANDGSAGIRRMLLYSMELIFCFSFENRRKLFDIDSRYKFATVVARNRAPTGKPFTCAFYLTNVEWLFEIAARDEELRYSTQFVEETAGDQLNFLELRHGDLVPLAHAMYRARDATFGEMRLRLGIRPTEELHKSKNRWRLVLTDTVVPDSATDPRSSETAAILRKRGFLPLVEGKTFHQFTDTWENRPDFVVPVNRMADKQARLEASRYYRLAFRTIASSTNERTAIFAVLPPGVLCSNSSLPESAPWERCSHHALGATAAANSFAFDWLLRLTVASNVTYNFLDAVPVPDLVREWKFLAHCALRLSCNHSGYEALWREQVQGAWRESRVAFDWPVLADVGERRATRAAVDAVLARAYGLSREQYAQLAAASSR